MTSQYSDRLVAIREQKSERVADELTIMLIDRLTQFGSAQLTVASLDRFRCHARSLVNDAIGESFEQAGDHMLHDAIADTSMAGIATRLAKLLNEKEKAGPSFVRSEWK